VRQRLCVVSAALLLVACAKTKEVGKDIAHELNPVAASDVTVVQVESRGPYLLAVVHGPRIDLNFVAPATPVCARILAPEATSSYARHGLFGRFSKDGDICDPVGIASLAAWRDRQPRSRGRALPRGTARYDVLAQYDDVTLLRGRFPFTNRVGIPSGYDIVALIPSSEECQPLFERSEASIEFRDAGRMPFRLLAARGPCPILGFALPAEVAGAGG
jgi:hypothetical protein